MMAKVEQVTQEQVEEYFADSYFDEYYLGDVMEMMDHFKLLVPLEPKWKCPLDWEDCTENCGSYGCGN